MLQQSGSSNRARSNFRKVLCLSVVAVAASLSAQTQPTSHALLIGIESYAPPAGTALPSPGPGHKSDSRFAAGASWHSLEGPLTDVAAMHELLKVKYGFTDIRELSDQDATRKGILEAIDKLIADTQKGDLVVFYYSGHGSQRLDTKSSKNQRDQTIVPVDAWKGVKDIRDKELAALFNKIVYDKQARLTAIYDSCNSGTMARGITESVERTLPYDDDDVAKEPGALLEADLKRIPQKGDAVILAAAGPTESAVEARYPEDGLVHGAFTRALIRVLQQNSQALSAEDVVSAAGTMMHADHLSFQQPSVEGQVHRSLFGEPLQNQELHVRVLKTESGAIKLDTGSAAGFGVGTELTALEADADAGGKTVLAIKSIEGPATSTAIVKSGPAAVHPGEIFAVSNLVYPQAARLVIYLPKAGPLPSAAAIATTKAQFPSLTWVDDPSASPVEFLVMEGGAGWTAYGQNGRAVKPGPTAKGVAFLLLGPPASVVARIRATEPFKREAFRFTENPAEADYYLTARIRPAEIDNEIGTAEYALFDPRVLAAHKPEDYVRSAENDASEADLNGGTPPEVVCRTDLSFPVRTAWLHDARAGAAESSIAPAIARRIVRLGKLRVWHQLPSMASGVSDWPYHLKIARSNEAAQGSDADKAPLHPSEQYEIRLVATSEELSRGAIVPKYFYLFGFDCAANPYQIYPTDETNGIAQGPPPGPDGQFPTSFILTTEQVSPPFGADTLFLLATKEKLGNLSLLTNDEVIEIQSRGSGLDELMVDLNDAGSRGATPVATTWQVQQLVIPSRP